MSNGHISKNAVRHRVEELVGGEYRLKFSKDVLSWQESYAYHYEHVRGSPTHDNRVSCAKAKLTILKNKISDAFVMHGINTNAAIDYYFEATVGWVCNSFRRGYLTWGGTRNRWLKTPITECVCGMMAMIDALTMPPETFDVVKRMVPRIINGCSNDVLATEFNMDVDAVDKTRSLIGWAADRHSLQGVILQSVMAIDKEDVLSRAECKMVGLSIAGLTAESIAEELDTDVESVRQTLSALIRRQHLRQVNVRNIPQLQRRMVELAVAGMTDTKIADEIRTDARTVASTLAGLADRQALETLVTSGDVRVRWHAVLPRAVAGRSTTELAAEQVGTDSNPNELARAVDAVRRDLTVIARTQSWVKTTYKKSREDLKHAYMKGVAELQESWKVDSNCKLAASCLKWYECEVLRQTCGFADAYHEWGDCAVLENVHSKDAAYVTARARLRALAYVEYQVGQKKEHELYQAVARRFLSIKLQRELWWWNHQANDAEKSARLIEDRVNLHVSIRLLDRLKDPEKTVARLATEGHSIDVIASQCNMIAWDVRRILGELAGRGRDTKFSRLTECWER